MSSDNIQVAIRARPSIEREVKKKLGDNWTIQKNIIFQVDDNGVRCNEPYSFDCIFNVDKTNKDIYNTSVKPLISSAMEGFNSTIFAYGQTSSGKTHTMLGSETSPGIMQIAVEEIFSIIMNNSDRKYLIRISYLEIYNEKVNDLLCAEHTDMKVREDRDGNHFVESKEEVASNPSQVFALMRQGNKNRKVGCTDMNERSSRSHTIFKIMIEAKTSALQSHAATVSTLNFVDLAGSERISQTKAAGVRMKEGVHINKSLSTLGMVIRQLSDQEKFISFRDSKLTRLLQHALGGNAKTLVIATITLTSVEETNSTLAFAQRAKAIKNQPIVNEVNTTDQVQAELYALLKSEYAEKIRQLEFNNKCQIEELQQKLNAIACFEGTRTENRRRTFSAFDFPKETSALPIITPVMKLNRFVKRQPLPIINENKPLNVTEQDSDLETTVSSRLSVSEESLCQKNTLDPKVEQIEEELGSKEEQIQELKEQNSKYKEEMEILQAEFDAMKQKYEATQEEYSNFKIQHSPNLKQRYEDLENSYVSLKEFTRLEKHCRVSISGPEEVLQAQVTELKAANEELQQKLAASDEEVTNLKKSNNKLERLNKTLDTEKNKLAEINNQLETDFQFQRDHDQKVFKDREQMLLKRIEDMESKGVQPKRDIGTGNITELHQQIVAQKQEIKRLQDVVAMKEQEIIEKNILIYEYDEKMLEAVEQKSIAEPGMPATGGNFMETPDKTNNELNKLTLSIFNLEQDLDKYKKQLLDKEMEINGLIATIKNKDSEIALIKSEKKTIEKEQLDKLEEIKQMNGQLEELLKEKEIMRNQHLDEIQKITQAKNALILKYDTLLSKYKQTIDGWEMIKQSQSEELITLNANIMNKEKWYQEQEQAIGQLKTEIADKIKELEENGSQIETIKKERDEHLKTIEELRAEIVNVTKVLEARETQMKTISQDSYEKVQNIDKSNDDIIRVTQILEEKESQMEKMRQEKDQHIDKLQAEIINITEVLKEKESQIEIIRHESDDKENNISKLKEEIISITKKLEEKESQMVITRKENDEKDQNIDGLKAEINNVSKMLKEKESQIEIIRQESEGKENNISKLKEEIIITTKELEEKESQMLIMKKENDEKDQNIDRLKAEINSFSDVLKEKESELDIIRQENKDNENNISKLKEQITFITKELDETMLEIKVIREENSQNVKSLKEKENELLALKTRMKNLSKYENKITSLTDEHKQQVHALEISYKEQINLLSNKIEDKDLELKEERVKYENLLMITEEQKQDILRTRTEISKIQTYVEELTEMHANSNEERAMERTELKDQLQLFAQENESLAKSLEESSNSIMKAQDQHCKQINELHMMIQKSEETILELENNLIRLREENLSLTHTIKLNDNKISELNGEIDKLMHQTNGVYAQNPCVGSLNKHVLDKDVEIQKLRSQVEALSKENKTKLDDMERRELEWIHDVDEKDREISELKTEIVNLTRQISTEELTLLWEGMRMKDQKLQELENINKQLEQVAAENEKSLQASVMKESLLQQQMEDLKADYEQRMEQLEKEAQMELNVKMNDLNNLEKVAATKGKELEQLKEQNYRKEIDDLNKHMNRINKVKESFSNLFTELLACVKKSDLEIENLISESSIPVDVSDAKIQVPSPNQKSPRDEVKAMQAIIIATQNVLGKQNRLAKTLAGQNKQLCATIEMIYEKLEETNDEVTDLHNALETKQLANRMLNEENETYKSDMMLTLNRMEETILQNTALNKHIEHINSCIANFKSNEITYTQKISDMLAKLDAKEATIISLSQQNNDLENHLKKARNEKKKQREELDTQRETIAKLQSNIQSLQTCKPVSSDKARADKYFKESVDLSKKLILANQCVSKLNCEAENHQIEVSKMAKQIRDLDQKAKSYKQKYSELLIEINDRDNKLDELLKKYQEAVEMITVMKEKKMNTSQLKEEPRPRSPQELRKLKRQSLQDKCRNVDSCEICKIHEETIERSNKDIEKLTKECASKDEQIGKLLKQVDHLETLMNEENDEIIKLQNQLSLFEGPTVDKIKELSKELQETKDELVTTRKKYRDSLLNIRDKDFNISLYEKEVQQLKKKLKEDSRSKQLLQDKYRNVDSCKICKIHEGTIERTNKDIEKLAKECTSKDEQIEKLRKQIDHLETLMNEENDEIVKLQNQLSVFEGPTADKIKELSKELQETKNELVITKKKYQDSLIDTKDKDTNISMYEKEIQELQQKLKEFNLLKMDTDVLNIAINLHENIQLLKNDKVPEWLLARIYTVEKSCADIKDYLSKNLIQNSTVFHKLHTKYRQLESLARLRRSENIELKKRLGIPPDDPVV
ncbi:centromere-associated protein E isoform X2 [Aethina tumida]|uniref:centromere-associated protein E isoform X2 n=1 Tax=Aethina tumida TaxID=116153 RepID=UPI00214829D7|nr:centromere-associated protein E isoform X2 [Aethina tumida]